MLKTKIFTTSDVLDSINIFVITLYYSFIGILPIYYVYINTIGIKFSPCYTIL